MFTHTVLEQMPEVDAVAVERESPQVDRAGREMGTAALQQIPDKLGLVEVTGADGDAALPLHAVGGPLDRLRLGGFRTYTRDDGTRIVYSKLAVNELGTNTHQVYGFTAANSAIPHLFLDTAISPNTEGTSHFGLDPVSRVDLGANHDYTTAVYGPLDDERSAALSQPGVMPVPELGPLQWSLRSPWMAAAIVARADLKKLGNVVDAYVEH